MEKKFYEIPEMIALEVEATLFTAGDSAFYGEEIPL